MRYAATMAALAAFSFAAAAAPHISRPMAGMPAVVTPGDAFPVLLSEAAELGLRAPEATYPLPAPDAAGLCMLPPETKPGVYALEARNATGTFRRAAAVHVLAAWPDAYTVAHVGNLGLAAGDAEARSRAAAALAEAAQAPTSLILISGPVTRDGSSEACTQVESLLAALPVPSVIAPEADASAAFAAHFGAAPNGLRFGADAYFALDTSGALPLEDTAPALAGLYSSRRAFRAARWSIGVTRRYSFAVGMRAQIALFVDDPLDVLLVTTAPEVEGEVLRGVPWGRTRLLPAPADSPVQRYTVSLAGVRPAVPPGNE